MPSEREKARERLIEVLTHFHGLVTHPVAVSKESHRKGREGQEKKGRSADAASNAKAPRKP